VKALASRLSHHGSRRKDFQRDVAIEALVMRAKDNTHPSGTDLFQNAVMGECGLHGDILDRVLRFDPLGSRSTPL